MIRVNKQRLCPICEKPDWCMVAEDKSAAICARVSEGATKRVGDAGWLHVLCDPASLKLRRTSIRPKPISRRQGYGEPSVVRRLTTKNIKLPDFAGLAGQYQERISQRQIRWLGASLGVSSTSLKRLGTGYDGRAFTFPMRDENCKIIGIRRRFGDGNKNAVTGSRNGLFIPAGLSTDKPLFITEGPTDTAAALDMGFEAIGRPNCDSKIEMTVRFARGRRVMIICDNDPPGREGAKKLATELILHCPAVKITTPPAEGMDLRQWKQAGFPGRKTGYGF